MHVSTSQTSYERREQAARRLILGVVEFKHGYVTVPSQSETEPHVVHVDHNYMPDYCTCKWHLNTGGMCVHKLAAYLYYAERREQLQSEPVYLYYDLDYQKRRLVEPVCKGRYSQLTEAERRQVENCIYDPNYFNTANYLA
jgi:hypothetical protein